MSIHKYKLQLLIVTMEEMICGELMNDEKPEAPEALPYSTTDLGPFSVSAVSS